MTTGIFHDKEVIPKKYVEWQYIEAVLLRLDSPYTANAPAQPFQEVYFDPTSIKKGRRIVAVSITSTIEDAGAPMMYEGVNLIQGIDLANFGMTLINRQGEQQVKDFPLFDVSRLNAIFTGAPSNATPLVRIFDVIPNMKKSFVMLFNNAFAIPANSGILFNFYTVDW